MISYVYLLLVLFKLALSQSRAPLYFRRPILPFASMAGLVAATTRFAMAFVPSRQIASLGSSELKMILPLLAVLGLASGLFTYYWRLRPNRAP
jgi:hypothetical protein